jgi:hypothetical protein
VRLELIAWGEAPVRLTGPFIRGGGTVALEHRPGPPAGDAHEVGLVAALGEPGVGEAVAELVGMQARDAGRLAAAVQHAEAEQLVAASAGVEGEHDDGGVAAREETRAADKEKCQLRWHPDGPLDGQAG